MNKKPTVLMILDGYGLNRETEGNAIAHANKPNLDQLFANYPFVEGHASGLDVGLPHGQMGNSEVGHLNMGAGRTVYQELTRITKDILDNDFFDNKAFLAATSNCKKNETDLHLFGLLSDGGVHSHITHLYALLRLAKQQNVPNVYVHCFLDGRDTPPNSGKEFIRELEETMRAIGVGKIATIMGRYYAMDRDNRWDRVKLAYDAMVNGEGNQAVTAQEAIDASYSAGIQDEFVLPTIILEEGKITATIKPNDSVIFFNFRPDRAREITRTFCDEIFVNFERTFMPLKFITFNDYDITIKNTIIAFEKDSLSNTLGEYLASKGVKQLRLAETEKYAHVTFFFNGGVEEPNEGETRVLVASPRVDTYDLQPEMSAYKVGEALVQAIESKSYDFIVVNFANPDMVGHTGIEKAAIEAIEVVDQCVGAAMKALLDVGGNMFLCADHGNAEQLIDYVTHEPFTAHTLNPVPFSLFNYEPGVTLKEGGKLADIAPTLLEMMGYKQPKEMTGSSLLQKTK